MMTCYVDAALQERLLALNRAFYERLARPFADSRSNAQESLAQAAAYAQTGASVLDVGCGDGRLARALAAAGRTVRYTGVDASQALLALAHARTQPAGNARFLQADIAQPGWTAGLATLRFDAVFCLAVLHHIPGHLHRQRLLEQMAGLLAPGGLLIVSTWQFLVSPRLRRKVVPWETIGVDTAQVAPGDYLLDWQRGGYGLRYCALIGEDDLRHMLAGAGLTIRSAFSADRGLNLFAVAQQNDSSTAG